MMLHFKEQRKGQRGPGSVASPPRHMAQAQNPAPMVGSSQLAQQKIGFFLRPSTPQSGAGRTWNASEGRGSCHLLPLPQLQLLSSGASRPGGTIALTSGLSSPLPFLHTPPASQGRWGHLQVLNLMRTAGESSNFPTGTCLRFDLVLISRRQAWGKDGGGKRVCEGFQAWPKK